MKIKKLNEADKITILSLSWRDIKSPKSGGAEIHTHEILKRADKNKYRIIHISMSDGVNSNEEIIDGIRYIRYGNFISVIIYAMFFYYVNNKNIDFVIDQCNTHRFFSKFWVKKNKRIFYIHQLTREIWDIHLGFPWNKIGKHLETFLLRLNKNDYTITISESTKKDLIDVGFDGSKIFIVPEYITTEPVIYSECCEKNKPYQFVYCGRYAKYKGIDTSIKALALAKKKYPDIKLVVVGKKDEEYVNSQLIPLCNEIGLSISDTDATADVFLTGFVSDDEKINYMAKSRCLLFPSIREGWGLIITEAAVVGTPSIVFNAPGSVDAVNKGYAGYLCNKNSEIGVVEKMMDALSDDISYEKVKKAAYVFSTEYLEWGKRMDVINYLISSIKKEER